MATDGTLLQGEVSKPTDNPLLDGAFVENLLAGFLKSIVMEQMTDLRKEAGASDINRLSPAPIQNTSTELQSSPVETHPPVEEGKPHLKFIRGGKAGNA